MPHFIGDNDAWHASRGFEMVGVLWQKHEPSSGSTLLELLNALMAACMLPKDDPEWHQCHIEKLIQRFRHCGFQLPQALVSLLAV